MTERECSRAASKPGAHLVVGGQVDGDAAAVVAVVGLGHHRAELARRAHRSLALLTISWRGTGRPSVPRILLVSSLSLASSTAMCGVRPVTVAWMRCWYLPWPSCTERLLVQAQPRDVAFLGRTHQRRGRRTERAPLRVADEVVARACPSSQSGGVTDAGPPGSSEVESFQREFAGGDALLLLRVFVHHRIHARSLVADAAGAAEGDVLAGDVLQLDRDMFEHVPEPGAFVLAHAADETAGSLYEQPCSASPGNAATTLRLTQARGGRSARLPGRRGRVPAG
jgi:hypothetical protein